MGDSKEMRVSIVQPSFLPWRGYFDLIKSVDIFVFLDDVQYTPRDWRNRNKLKTPRGAEWVSVPVRYRSRSQLICDSEIVYDRDWYTKILGSWTANYRRAKHFGDGLSILNGIKSEKFRTISELNIYLTILICQYLSIKTMLVKASDLAVGGVKTSRLINIIKQVGGDVYLSGPSADDYLEKNEFIKSSIRLEYKTYIYTPYEQLWGDFIGDVSVLDLIACTGRDSLRFIESCKPNKVVV